MSNYNAKDIEVLTGLDPVRKRPGMYTDTSRPNHLAQEVIDNSVDEALAGHASRVEVTLHKDGSLSVFDDGRGMPVDIHPEQGITYNKAEIWKCCFSQWKSHNYSPPKRASASCPCQGLGERKRRHTKTSLF